ncbi:unnamed protein product [Linum trigynum]|uniref:Uncharacterized protein n=1 Tax=Linum trigynum TaxID=586398 RepID=A0AAV2GVX8_9ROSI
MSVEEGGERGLLGGLDDHGAAGGQGGADLHEEHGAGEVPRDDEPHHADGLEECVGVKLPRHLQDLAVDLVGGAGEVAEGVGHGRDVDRFAPAEQLAGVQGVEGRQLLDVLVDQVRKFVHYLCPCLTIKK